MMLKIILALIGTLLAISAVGLLFFPAEMLAVVDIAATPTSTFLLRTSGVGVTALLPGIWSAWRNPNSPAARAVLFGIALYLVLSSIVDLWAYTQSLVNTVSIPSMLLRTLLGLLVLVLMSKNQHANALPRQSERSRRA